MNFKKIREFIDLAKETGVSKLSYDSEGIKISVSFEGSANAVPLNHSYQSTSALKPPVEVNKSHHVVKAPFVGTYYSSSGPGEPNYIKVGDKVTKGQILCILEAMKIMNEIEAEVIGTLVEACIDNESFVEFDQVLFKIAKD